MISRKFMSLLALPLVVGAVALSASPAAASTDPTQDQVDAVIAEFGGTQTASNEVTWDDGAVVLTIAPESTASRFSSPSGITAFSVGSCPSGYFCAYSGTSYTGSRLTFSSCTTGNSVAALGTVRSLANSRGYGTVRAYAGWSTVATLGPNTGAASVSAGIDKLNCS
ncbi:peptidase inhibitor family I36 protein [Microbacterium kyungheense]|uniref:Peptidase inhibitor family I36 n=1 Tax=Microbacterium kyungheense TaxID=1263636 RepID=A0A543FK91_9MICO|nr:peptidase inhibitor family I36 protein [Microbacterium kyungheense]TQM34293.1 peptidase inhibitor family I36 [Microbacterium kyungheense]